MNTPKLPPLPEHPEPRIMEWTKLEMRTIKEYGEACAIAAIEAQGVPDGWQPIATAPESMNECVVVGWIDDEGSPRTEFDYKEDGCWIKWHEHAEHTEVIGGHGVSYTPPYTHWLKMPPLASAPPATGMTAQRAAYFMDRFKHEEKLLGPNEQAALDFVLDMLNPAQQAKPQPLSDEKFQEIKRSLLSQLGCDRDGWDQALKEAIEVALGIKE